MKTIIMQAKIKNISDNDVDIELLDAKEKSLHFKKIHVIFPVGIECFPQPGDSVALGINVRTDGTVAQVWVLGSVKILNSKHAEHVDVTRKIRCTDLFAHNIAADAGNQLIAKTAFDSHFHPSSGSPPMTFPKIPSLVSISSVISNISKNLKNKPFYMTNSAHQDLKDMETLLQSKQAEIEQAQLQQETQHVD